jgi:hypothetical protein
VTIVSLLLSFRNPVSDMADANVPEVENLTAEVRADRKETLLAIM